MSPEGLLTRSRPQRGNLTGLQGGPRVQKQCRTNRRRCQGLLACEAKHALSCIPRQRHPPTPHPTPLGLTELLLGSLRGLGVLGGLVPVVLQGA